ncbi:MAG: excinuclease ABC subunit B [Candidatus Buchananbacteria bacterium CG10_big_fil_rev_8_21_14_0_10_42_9]|uniref:UvrABC system protein B n=1 Tax=Candidatus Buchananbacteria bacterium CG10_big_fil_rev_8_21_14_0_10_42_9 TaxID=1974526 RepID=A0A2H0W1M6_9BACT|nr:MAG: excinuclease ABC subunit B [Candidatus Buchananbacteria bacterium CG10_big_fil_rev_8_21_14_0_10_42_9]
MQFQLDQKLKPKGDQPKAIKQLVAGYKKHRYQTLLGVTGSGKTFTMANVISRLQRPALILSHNKTLAAQLYQEFQNFFPNNKVGYFVSYYDYYQPESYLPKSDTYIEKDMSINEQVERMRMEAAGNIMSNDDVIIVSSVSCIYGFGNPDNFESQSFFVSTKKAKNAIKLNGPDDLARKLIELQYERNDIELAPGRFRVKGDTVDAIMGGGTIIIRFSFFGDELEKIKEVDPRTDKVLSQFDSLHIFPAKAFVAPEEDLKRAIVDIQNELKERLPKLDTVEAYRLKKRTEFDIEMMQQLGYCKGIENYSRHIDGRRPGQPPYTLLDYFDYRFGQNWLMFIDESHVTLPQVGGMYEGDHSRKKNLVDYGFRLPSAYDNRPLKINEFAKYNHHVIYVSATPAEEEVKKSGQVVEQIIRPTGVADPPVEVRPIEGQVVDLIKEIKATTDKGYRTLVTTLTKRMAEDLSQYLKEAGIKTEYLHSEIDTLERIEIIKRLRLGKFDVLVGINLLREGLDIPEVALVGILDADKEGFLRNERSLIQTIGRAARNIDSKVILYADKITGSIKRAIGETDRRRKIQLAYNKKHNITPASIKKLVAAEAVVIEPDEKGKELDLDKLILDLEGQMQAAADRLDFEKAIELRDKVDNLKLKLINVK